MSVGFYVGGNFRIVGTGGIFLLLFFMYPRISTEDIK